MELAVADVLGRFRDGTEITPGSIQSAVRSAALSAPGPQRGALQSVRRLLAVVRRYLGGMFGTARQFREARESGALTGDNAWDSFVRKLEERDAGDKRAHGSASQTSPGSYGASFALRPEGPGVRAITTAPPALSRVENPFSGTVAATPKQWRSLWDQWSKTSRRLLSGVVTVPEGDITLSGQTRDHLRFVREGEAPALHFEAAARIRELLQHSVLAAVEAPRDYEKGAAEIHRRYAWMQFADGRIRHVLLTVKRWNAEAALDTDSAYSLEALEIRETAGGSSPGALADSRADTGDPQESLTRFLNGIKPEHRSPIHPLLHQKF